MENSTSSYGPFWPLQILLLFLCLWLGYHIVVLNQARTASQAGLLQVNSQVEASLASKKRLIDLAQDLLQVSSGSSAAVQIVKEFDIHVVKPPAAEETK